MKTPQGCVSCRKDGARSEIVPQSARPDQGRFPRFTLTARRAGAWSAVVQVCQTGAVDDATDLEGIPPAASGPVDPPPVALPDSELRQLRSPHADRPYHLYIGLPQGYDQSSDRYPVLYLLDGQWDFRLVTAIYSALLFDRFVPEMIIVGISYGGEQPDYDALRVRDYTPTAMVDFAGSGGAPEFLTFLQEELIPFVESGYRVESDRRVLAGSSLGGLFGLYSLFTEPDLFGGYLSISPVIPWGENVLLRLEDRLAKRRDDLPVRLFLAAGELEPESAMVGPVQRLAARLRGRSYWGLELTEMVIPGERHAGVKAEAFNRGLRAAFEPRSIDLPVEALAQFAGEYRNVDEGKALHLVFAVDETQLVLQAAPDSHEADQLQPRAENLFAFRKIPGEISFQRNPAGGVAGATIHLTEGDRRLEKAT